MNLVEEFKDLLGTIDCPMPDAVYEVEIVETRRKVVKIQMPIGSYHDAEAEVYRQYVDGEIQMTDTDVSAVDISVEEIIYPDEEEL